MPQMQLSTLVLPAPLGPTRHNSSPLCVFSETPCRTCRPPNDRPTSASSRAASSAIPASASAVLLDVAVAPRLIAAEAEVELTYVGMLAQCLRCARQHDAAVLNDIGLIGHLESNRRVLLHQQQRHAQLPADRPE